MPGRILVLRGPDLNLLGQRGPEVCGPTALAEIDEMCRAEGKRLGLDVDCQSNSEGDLVGLGARRAGRFRRSDLERRCPRPHLHRLARCFTFAQQTLD